VVPAECASAQSSKTGTVIFGTGQRLSTIHGTHCITVAGSSVHFSDAVKLLGVTLDQALSFDENVSNVVCSCTYHTRSPRHIRPLITADAAKMIASCIVGARLDYCNSLLFGTTARNLDHLQRVHNTLARVVLQEPFSAHLTELRRQLHWLLIGSVLSTKLLR